MGTSVSDIIKSKWKCCISKSSRVQLQNENAGFKSRFYYECFIFIVHMLLCYKKGYKKSSVLGHRLQFTNEVLF